MLDLQSMIYLSRTLLFQEILIFVCLGCLRANLTEADGVVALSKDPPDLDIAKLSRQKRASGTVIPISMEEREAGVLRHNEYRAKQNASNMEYMTWNSELARMAEEYIGKCVFEHSDMLNRDKEYDFTYKRVGENLHYNTKELSLAKAVDAWYIEINDYTYESNTCATGKVCGHYTQVVWAKSEMVGCAKVMCPLLEVPYKKKTVKNAVYTGCNYGGPGNMAGIKPFLLGDPCSACDQKSYPTDHGCKMGMCYIETDEEEGANSGGTGTNSGGTGANSGGTGANSGGTGTDTGSVDGDGDGNPAGCLRTFNYHIVFPLTVLYTTLSQ